MSTGIKVPPDSWKTTSEVWEELRAVLKGGALFFAVVEGRPRREQAHDDGPSRTLRTVGVLDTKAFLDPEGEPLKARHRALGALVLSPRGRYWVLMDAELLPCMTEDRETTVAVLEQFVGLCRHGDIEKYRSWHHDLLTLNHRADDEMICRKAWRQRGGSAQKRDLPVELKRLTSRDVHFRIQVHGNYARIFREIVAAENMDFAAPAARQLLADRLGYLKTKGIELPPLPPVAELVEAAKALPPEET